MRISLATILVLAVIAGAPVAQVSDTRQILFGPQVGLTLSSTSGDISDVFEALGVDQSARVGFGGGAALRIPVGQSFAIQPEFMYVMKGEKYEAEGEEITFKYDYIDIPVLFQVVVPTSGSIHPRFFAGPNLSVLVSAEADGIGQVLDLEDESKTIAWGLGFGTGLDIAMANGGAFTFDLSYNIGLSTLWDGIPAVDEGGEVIGAVEVDEKSSHFAFYVGYMFGL